MREYVREKIRGVKQLIHMRHHPEVRNIVFGWELMIVK